MVQCRQTTCQRIFKSGNEDEISCDTTVDRNTVIDLKEQPTDLIVFSIPETSVGTHLSTGVRSQGNLLKCIGIQNVRNSQSIEPLSQDLKLSTDETGLALEFKIQKKITSFRMQQCKFACQNRIG